MNSKKCQVGLTWDVVDMKLSEKYSAGDSFISIWHASEEKYLNQNKTEKWASFPTEKKKVVFAILFSLTKHSYNTISDMLC